MLSPKGLGYPMTEQLMSERTTEVFDRHFRTRRAGQSASNQAYLALWMAYQHGALSADEFMRSVEHEFLHNVDQLKARWTAVKW
jgi:hypothetical protein